MSITMAEMDRGDGGRDTRAYRNSSKVERNNNTNLDIYDGEQDVFGNEENHQV